MRILCIINSQAGPSKKSRLTEIKQLFAAQGSVPAFIEVNRGDDIAAIIKTSLREKYDIIVAGGGDGTINAIASALVGEAGVRFGILPMGTLNHFARDLGIPTGMSAAVDTIIAGTTTVVDVGSVNGEIFLNNSSVGLYPAIVKLREGLQRSGYSKWTAAAWATLRIMLRFRTLHLELQPHSGPTERRTTALLFVGNNAYETSPLRVGTRLELNQGKLWITMPESPSRWKLFVNLISISLGIERPEEVYKLEATSLTVNSKRRLLQVAVDGEVRPLQPPLKYQILPISLRVIVPRDDGAAT